MERGDSGEQSCGPALRWGAHLDGGRRGLPDGHTGRGLVGGAPVPVVPEHGARLCHVAGPLVDVPRAAPGGRALERGRRAGGVGVPVVAAQRPHGRACPRPGRGRAGPGDVASTFGGVDLLLPLARGCLRGAGRRPVAARGAAAGEWRGNLRDRLLFALLAESGMRIGEVLGLRISDFVMGRGGTPYVEIVPRLDNPNGARVKLMRPRRVYVGSDLERLFADYLTQLACRAATLGVAVTAASPLLVNLQRPPFLGALGAGTVRDKTTALRKKGIGPPDWTPHWFRHSHATTLLLAGTPEWVVSRRLGHAHVQTTLDLYGWVREDEALRAAANWKSFAAAWQVHDGQ